MTTIRRTAVRDTGVCQHHGHPIQGPFETPRALQHYDIEGFKWEGGTELCPSFQEDEIKSDTYIFF